MTERVRHFVNLTNGIEALSGLVADGAPWSFMRLQSTTVERRDWTTLFERDLSDDLLIHLALGWRCVLHDRGTNRPLSKTVYYAIPLVRYVLDRRWYGLRPDAAWMTGRRGGRGVNAARYFDEVYRELVDHGQSDSGRVRRRLDYHARYLVSRPVGEGVDLVGACGSTDRDGDQLYYADVVRAVLGDGPARHLASDGGGPPACGADIDRGPNPPRLRTTDSPSQTTCAACLAKYRAG